MDLEALSVTFRLAAITTAILLVIAIPLAYWIVSTRSRLRAASPPKWRLSGQRTSVLLREDSL